MIQYFKNTTFLKGINIETKVQKLYNCLTLVLTHRFRDFFYILSFIEYLFRILVEGD